MLNRRPFRAQELHPDEQERARIQARLDALERDRENDSTRRFTLTGTGSLVETVHPSQVSASEPETEVESRAYLMTGDGGVLAEIPCNEQAGIITLGRGKAAEIRIHDPYVHRLQAEIRWDEHQKSHVLSHGGGENPTYVNRHPIQAPHSLYGGERLRFGRTNLVYRIRR